MTTFEEDYYESSEISDYDDYVEELCDEFDDTHMCDDFEETCANAFEYDIDEYIFGFTGKPMHSHNGEHKDRTIAQKLTPRQQETRSKLIREHREFIQSFVGDLPEANMQMFEYVPTIEAINKRILDDDDKFMREMKPGVSESDDCHRYEFVQTTPKK